MAYKPDWIEAIRMALAVRGEFDLVEKSMFGGRCFFDRGNMLCGVGWDHFMFRVGKAQEAEALSLPGAEPVMFNGRKMGGMVFVEPEAAQADLPRWLELCFNFTGTLPAK